MNRFFKRTFAVVTAAVLLLSLPVMFSAAGEAGTADDPLVTLSYITEVLKPELKQEIYQELYDSLKADLFNGTGLVMPGNSTSSAYTVVCLVRGQKLNALDACEIILSSGTADCFVTSQENLNQGIGLRDCTTGEEITNQMQIPARHYVIIPRGDGRGALVTSDVAYFMVRGAYEIVG